MAPPTNYSKPKHSTKSSIFAYFILYALLIAGCSFTLYKNSCSSLTRHIPQANTTSSPQKNLSAKREEEKVNIIEQEELSPMTESLAIEEEKVNITEQEELPPITESLAEEEVNNSDTFIADGRANDEPPFLKNKTVSYAQNKLIIYPAPQSVRDFYDAPRYRVRARPAGSTKDYHEIFVFGDKNRSVDVTSNSARLTNHAQYWASLAFEGSLEVIVEFLHEKANTHAEIRPLSDAIKCTKSSPNTLKFTLTKPGQFWVYNSPGEQPLYPLFIFADPPEENVPKLGDKNVFKITPGSDYQTIISEITSLPLEQHVVAYFTPGLHHIGYLENKWRGNSTFYVAAGATVFCSIKQKNLTDYSFRGRGVYHGGHEKVHWPSKEGFPKLASLENTFKEKEGIKRVLLIQVSGYHSRRGYIEGLTMLNQRGFMLGLLHEEKVMDNIKVMGWAPNTDGISNGGHSKLTNSFVKVMDDNMGLSSNDILVSNIVVFRQSNGNIFRMERVGGTGLIDITIKDIDVIYSEQGATIYHSRGFLLMGESKWKACEYKNILFERISINSDINMFFAIKASTLNTMGKYFKLNKRFQSEMPVDTLERWIEERKGTDKKMNNPRDISNMTFKDISIKGLVLDENGFFAEGDGSIRNITFENCIINGVPLKSLKDFGEKSGFKKPFYVVGNKKRNNLSDFNFIYKGKKFVEKNPMSSYPLEKDTPEGFECIKLH